MADGPSPLDPRDEWVVVRCQLGERSAFEELIERWHPSLWRYSIHLAGNQDAAAEMTQDVWIRVLRGLPRLREASRFKAWLFQIARRVHYDRLRARYTSPTFEPLDADAFEAPEPGTDEEDVARMEQELANLPVAEREILALFYLQDFSLGDIASLLQVPVGTVKSRLFRARRLLRARLAPGGSRS